jgi:hypothetical protein
MGKRICQQSGWFQHHGFSNSIERASALDSNDTKPYRIFFA